MVVMCVENGTSVSGTTLSNNMQFLALQFNIRKRLQLSDNGLQPVRLL